MNFSTMIIISIQVVLCEGSLNEAAQNGIGDVVIIRNKVISHRLIQSLVMIWSAIAIVLQICHYSLLLETKRRKAREIARAHFGKD